MVYYGKANYMTSVKLPNFLIVGAPKCGTTSLYHYLAQHPEVYMSPVKEPRFITSQFVKFPLKGTGDEKAEKNFIKTFDVYKKLFENVNNEKAIGEASADNLYLYKDSVKYIKDYIGDVKIIIILRDPVERTFSNYQMLLAGMREHLSFEDALRAEEQRKKMNWAYAWHYKSISFYYNQVKAYMENFSRIKIYLYEDLQADTALMIKDLYKFLQVDTTFMPDTHFQYNVGGIPKSKFIQKLLLEFDVPKNVVKQIFYFFLSKEKTHRLKESFKKRNMKKIQMKPETRSYLRGIFRKDILKLQDLIQRDLSHWLE